MDRRELIRDLFPDHLRENMDYSVFIDMSAEELGLVADYIELFSELGSVTDTPEQFLENISYELGFNYSDSRDPDAQRDAMKRIFSVYEQRGTEESILKTADYANHYDWVGGDIFLSKDDIPDRYATIIYPKDRVFTHSVSKHSGVDKFQDGVRWRSGVIILQMSEVSDRIREALKTVIPAGVKYYFNLVSNPEGSPGHEGSYGEVSFGEWTITEDYVINYNIPIKEVTDSLVFSDSTYGGLRSGRQLLFDYSMIEKSLGASFINNSPLDKSEDFSDLVQGIRHVVDYEINGFDSNITYRGLPIRSEFSGIRSGKYSQSGTRSGEVSSISQVYEIKPSDLLYNVSEVGDLMVGDYLRNHNSSTEVLVEKVT